MFGLSKSKHAPATGSNSSALGKKGSTPSVIATDMNVLGNIISEGLLDIDGKIDGNVRCHTVSIRENGRVKGDVIAEVAYVYGTIEGLLKAKSVTLFSSARVLGSIMHEALSIEDGAFIDGKLKRTDRIAIEDAPFEARLPQLDNFDNDNEETTSEAERLVLENLRLIR